MKRIFTKTLRNAIACVIAVALLLTSAPSLEVQVFALDLLDSTREESSSVGLYVELNEENSEQTNTSEDASIEASSESETDIDVDADFDSDINVPISSATDITLAAMEIMPLAASGSYEYTLSGSNATITKYTGTETNLIIPDTIDGYSVVTIGEYAFQNCTALQNVTIPDSVTSIGRCAFQDCTNLSSVTLSKNLNSLGYAAFRNTAITSIEIPKSLTTASSGSYPSSGPFYECSNLTTIIFEAGIETIPDRLFARCDGIREIVIPSTVTSIGGYAFYGCTNLTSVTMLEPLTTIGSNAFSGCTNLSRIVVPDTVTSFGSNAFRNCSEMVFHCNENSFATIYAIDNDIPFTMLSDTYEDSDYLYLNRSRCLYTTSLSDMSASGHISLLMEYAVKDSATASVSDMVIKIRVPSGTELMQNTLIVNDVRSTNFTVDGSTLSIPIDEMTGTVRFSVKPSEYAWFTSYAILDFKHNETKNTEVIGIVNKDLPVLTLITDPETDNASFEVSGVALPNKQVSLYIDDVYQTAVTSSKSGAYHATLTLSEPKNYKSYKITAESTDKTSARITAEKIVIYEEGTPVLTEFVMSHNNQTYILSQEAGFKPIVTFLGGREFEFTVKFRNMENIKAVYVVSDRSNVKKKMEAIWDEEKQAFYAKGFFDPSNRNYVPGSINVEYLGKGKTVSLWDDIDFSNDEYVNILPDEFKNAQINVLASNETEFEAIVTFHDLDSSELYMSYTISDLEDGITPETAEADGYTIISDPVVLQTFGIQATSAGEKIAVKYSEEVFGEIESSIIDFGKESVYKHLMKVDPYKAAGFNSLDTLLGSLGKVQSAYNTYNTYDGQRIDINNARSEILSSSRSHDEKASALTYLDTAQKINQHNMVQKYFFTAVSLLGLVSPPLGIAITAMNFLSDFQMEQTMLNVNGLASRQSGGVAINFRWAIDPSGIVYDLLTGEPIEGATATVFYKENEEDLPTLWDASEYEQHNPLITDADGKYAWDVPEGLWQVKVEKEGYTTAYSDWLPVPPPQTDVNIGLIPYGKFAIIAVAGVGGTVLGSGAFDANAEVRLIAKPQIGYVFDGWYENDMLIVDVEAEYSFAATENRNLEVRFKTSMLLGDANNSGSITLADVMLIYQHYRGKSLLTGNDLLAADVNESNTVTLADVMLVYQYYRGKINVF